MKIRARDTFEQNYQRMSAGGSFGAVDFLKFLKNTVYEFYIVPKVVSIDLVADECEVDYPFEEVNTHFGIYDFMKDYARMKPARFNCTGCAIDNWMAEHRVPKTIFKIAVPTKFFVCYVIHDKKIKVAWLQDYLYAILMEKIARIMSDKELNLIDAFRHRVKLFTNPEGKFDIEINETVSIPAESQGFKNILVSVNEKPLDRFIDQQVTCDNETVDAVLHALKDYTDVVIKAEKDRGNREKMEEKSEQFKASIEGFKNDSYDYKSGGNEPFVESVGPAAETSAEPNEDIPF